MYLIIAYSGGVHLGKGRLRGGMVINVNYN